jgi:uncharacterized cofD-like protein
MRLQPRGALRWLYPGMRVKRWGVLALVSVALIVLALMAAVGRSEIERFYHLLPHAPIIQDLIIAAALLVGLAGFIWGLRQLVHSIAGGIAPGRLEKPSTMIYRTRVLERGPRVVALGGGTGLSTLLRGMKEVTANLTAVVTVTDDGGSSGRLRSELDVLPPGDVRNCILALAEDEARMAGFFQHRFWGPSDLSGHSLGNLLLVGLEQATGGFDRAIEAMGQILNVRGQVLPATLAKTHLAAEMEDGEWIEGETRLTADPRRIRRVRLSTPNVPPHDRVIEAIETAELILLGPGSLFTSLVPNLLVEGIAQALAASGAEKILVANLMTQPGETEGFSLRGHLRILAEYVDLRSFDTVLVNDSLPSQEILDAYRADDSEPVANDLGEENEYALAVVTADLLGTALLEGKTTVKHDPAKLARAIVRHSRAFAHRHSERMNGGNGDKSKDQGAKETGSRE